MSLSAFQESQANETNYFKLQYFFFFFYYNRVNAPFGSENIIIYKSLYFVAFRVYFTSSNNLPAKKT